jgi:plasmid stability protein
MSQQGQSLDIYLLHFSEHMKFIRAAEHAFDLESQKRDILQEYVDDYESHVYRVCTVH